MFRRFSFVVTGLVYGLQFTVYSLRLGGEVNKMNDDSVILQNFSKFAV